MKTMTILFLSAIIFIGHAKDNPEISNLQKEINALTLLKKQKLDELESAEANRWNKRYNHNEELKLIEARGRQLESQYGTIARQLNRKQEDVLLLKNALDDQNEKLSQVTAQFDGFTLQVTQTIEDAADNIGLDFPFNI